jgi:hypothetical protein
MAETKKEPKTKTVIPQPTVRLRKVPKVEPVQPRYLSFRQAGAYMSSSPEALRMKVRRGQIPAVQLGKRVYVDRLALDALMQSNPVTLTS